MLGAFGLLLVQTAKRSHDIGRSGMWALLVTLPGVGLLAWVAFMLIPGGTTE